MFFTIWWISLQWFMSTGGRHLQTVMDPLHAVGHPGHLQGHLRVPAPGPRMLLPPVATDKRVLPAAALWCLGSSFYRYETVLVPVKKPSRCVLYWVLAVIVACSVIGFVAVERLNLITFSVANICLSVISMYEFLSVRDPFSVDFVWESYVILIQPWSVLTIEDIWPLD